VLPADPSSAHTPGMRTRGSICMSNLNTFRMCSICREQVANVHCQQCEEESLDGGYYCMFDCDAEVHSLGSGFEDHHRVMR
jgi:recombinational DNA repair protein RecR